MPGMVRAVGVRQCVMRLHPRTRRGPRRTGRLHDRAVIPRAAAQPERAQAVPPLDN